ADLQRGGRAVGAGRRSLRRMAAGPDDEPGPVRATGTADRSAAGEAVTARDLAAHGEGDSRGRGARTGGRARRGRRSAAAAVHRRVRAAVRGGCRDGAEDWVLLRSAGEPGGGGRPLRRPAGAGPVL